MRKILTHKEFINESSYTEYDKIVELIKEFIETDWKYTKHFMNNAYYKENYEADIRNLKNYLSNNDIDLDYFMQKYKNKIYQDEFFNSTSGFLDTLLYIYDNKFPLSGGELQDYGGGDEYLIKYFYGYDKYDLGRKYLLQKYKNIDDFYYDCANMFLNPYNIENYVLSDIFDNVEKYKDSFSKIIKKDEGYFILIDLKIFFSYNDFTVDELKENFNEHIRHWYRFDYRFITNKILLIGFGVSLNDINIHDYDKDIEEIEIKNTINKYNV